jgi:hypothetical protein
LHPLLGEELVERVKKEISFRLRKRRKRREGISRKKYL